MPRTNEVSRYFVSVIGSEGYRLKIHNISRYCEDDYECVAENGINPAAMRSMRVIVQCEYTVPVFCAFVLGSCSRTILKDILYLFSSKVCEF